MVKKDNFFDSNRYGSDKPNYTKTTKHIDVILDDDEFLKRLESAKKTRQNPKGGWRDIYAGLESEEVYCYKDEKAGIMVEEIRHIHRYDVLGNKVKVNDVVGKSWTEQLIAEGYKGKCLNPFGYHTDRTVLIGHDGFETGIVDELTGKMNVLCTECLEHQVKRLSLARWIGLGGLLWKPEEY